MVVVKIVGRSGAALDHILASHPDAQLTDDVNEFLRSARMSALSIFGSFIAISARDKSLQSSEEAMLLTRLALKGEGVTRDSFQEVYLLLQKVVVAYQMWASPSAEFRQLNVDNPMELFRLARQRLSFPHDADLLVPYDLVRRIVNKCRGTSVRNFLQGLRSPTACSTCHQSLLSNELDSEWCTIVINPTTSPVNPDRADKNKRLALIQSVCDVRDYNSMVRQANPNATIRADAAVTSSLSRTTTRGIGALYSETSLDEANGKKESYSLFMRNLSIGLDMRLMSLAGGVVGYYICYSRGQSVDICITGAAIGAVAMLFVDAILLVIRMGKEDLQEKRHRDKRGDATEGFLPSTRKSIDLSPSTAPLVAALDPKKNH